MTPHSELNERQELFCRHYVNWPVGASAARAAGYAPESADVQACRLLDRPDIRARIQTLRSEVAQQHCRDTDTILAKLETVYERAIYDHQYHAAARSLTLQARLAGLLAPDTAGPDADAPPNVKEC